MNFFGEKKLYTILKYHFLFEKLSIVDFEYEFNRKCESLSLTMSDGSKIRVSSFYDLGLVFKVTEEPTFCKLILENNDDYLMLCDKSGNIEIVLF